MAIAISGCGGGGTTGPAGSVGNGSAGGSGLTPSTGNGGETYSLTRYFNLDDVAVYDYDDSAKIIFGYGPVNLYPFVVKSYGNVFQFQFREDDPEIIDTSFLAFSGNDDLLYYGRYERKSGVGKCIVFSEPVEIAPGTVTSGATYTDQADFVVYNQCATDGATQDISGSISFSFTEEAEETISTTVGDFSVLKFVLIEEWSGTDTSSQSVSGTREVTFWMAQDTGPVRYENSDTGPAYHSVNTAIVGDTIYTSLDSVCGNGTQEIGEECDDGNKTSGDGCSSVCRDESIWIKTYGGTSDDGITTIKQTSDGGFIVAGYYIPDGSEETDLWLMKLDEAGGQTWSGTFGGASEDTARSAQQTSDGGYVVAGCTESSGAGEKDAWLLKVDTNGSQEWAQTFGGASDDCAESVQQTTDGGYIIAGHTSSSGAGQSDAWLLKTDNTGVMTWEKTFGGTSADYAYSVQQTSEGGYVVSGNTNSYGDGQSDVWILKLDASGAETWTKTYGATKDDFSYSIKAVTDERYIVAGSTKSYGEGGSDVWVLLLNNIGNQIWTRTFGDTGDEAGYSIWETTSGNYIVAGEQTSSANDKNIWLLNITVNGVDAWTKTYGGSYDDAGYSVLQTADGGFALAGVTKSTMNGGSDAWIMRTDSSGDCDKCLDTIVLLRR